MEVTDALRVPLDPAHVREALGDLALLRASLDNCESFARLPGGEYALTMIVPLGALRARYEIRAHTAGRTRQAAHAEGEPDAASPAGASSPSSADNYARTLSFKARGEGVGSLRGQIAVALNPDANSESTWVEYTVWATRFRSARRLAVAADRKLAARSGRRFLLRVLRSRACEARLAVDSGAAGSCFAASCVSAAEHDVGGIFAARGQSAAPASRAGRRCRERRAASPAAGARAGTSRPRPFGRSASARACPAGRGRRCLSASRCSRSLRSGWGYSRRLPSARPLEAPADMAT